MKNTPDLLTVWHDEITAELLSARSDLVTMAATAEAAGIAAQLLRARRKVAATTLAKLPGDIKLVIALQGRITESETAMRTADQHTSNTAREAGRGADRVHMLEDALAQLAMMMLPEAAAA